MLTVKSNLAEVSGRLVGRFSELTDVNGVVRDKLLRTIAVSMAADIRYRVHVEGVRADNTKLPNYSKSYLKYRQKKPFNRTSDKQMIFSLTRQMENDFGLTPEGGRSRKPSEDPIKTPNGYGLGFKNPWNKEKADWLQYGIMGPMMQAKSNTGKSKKKAKPFRQPFAGFGTVYGLTPQEKDRVREIAEEFIKGFNKKQF